MKRDIIESYVCISNLVPLYKDSQRKKLIEKMIIVSHEGESSIN